MKIEKINKNFHSIYSDIKNFKNVKYDEQR